MNRKQITISLIIVFIVVSGGIYYYTNYYQKQQNPNPDLEGYNGKSLNESKLTQESESYIDSQNSWEIVHEFSLSENRNSQSYKQVLRANETSLRATLVTDETEVYSSQEGKSLVRYRTNGTVQYTTTGTSFIEQYFEYTRAVLLATDYSKTNVVKTDSGTLTTFTASGAESVDTLQQVTIRNVSTKQDKITKFRSVVRVADPGYITYLYVEISYKNTRTGDTYKEIHAINKREIGTTIVQEPDWVRKFRQSSNQTTK